MLDYQREIERTADVAATIAGFHQFYYLRINRRRQEHLETCVSFGDDFSENLVKELSQLTEELLPQQTRTS
jgi:hypothetical protein